MESIRISEKYALSVEEAAEYFHLGVNKLRKLIRNNETAEWILWSGSHAYIKRVKFENYLDKICSI